jgi:hypothetical protein
MTSTWTYAGLMIMPRRCMWPMHQAGEWRFGPVYAEVVSRGVDA